MEQELLDQLKLVLCAMEKMATKEDIYALRDEMNELRGEIIRSKLYIENEVVKRIDSLFDGYKLTHEKQWETRRNLNSRADEMQHQIDCLQARLLRLAEQTV